MRYKQRSEAQDRVETYQSSGKNKEKHKGYTGYDIGIHERDIRCAHDERLYIPVFHAADAVSRRSAHDSRDKRRADGKDQGVLQRTEGYLVTEQLLIPSEREALHYRGALARVEAEIYQYGYRGEEEDEDGYRNYKRSFDEED